MDEDVRGDAPRRHKRLERVVDWIMPFSWSEYRWQFLSTFRRFRHYLLVMWLQVKNNLYTFKIVAVCF